MSWRVVVVSSNAKVDYKLDYLVVPTVDEVKRVHLSEVGVLMLESTAISLTTYLLCELMRRKIKVIVCDHQRNPCGELVPTCGCHDGSAKIRQQLRWDKGIRESVWTEIVRENKPPQGLIQMLTVTERQFARMKLVLGEYRTEIIDDERRLVIL